MSSSTPSQQQQQQKEETQQGQQQQGRQVSRPSTAMSPASKEDRNKVLVLTSTSHLGKAIVTELAQGPFAELFEVVAGVPLQEHQERREAIKQVGVQCVELDMEDVHKLAHGIQQINPKQIVVVGRSESRNVLHIRSVIDAVGRFERPPFLLLASVAQADLKNNRWAQEFDELEHHLKASEVPNYCIVRSLFHMENFLWFADSVKHDAALALPFERTLAPIATADVTRALAIVLKDCTPHHGKTLTLSGPQALSGPGMAECMSKALDKSVSFKKMTMDQCRDLLKSKGLSATTIDPFCSFCESIDRGDTYFVSNAFQVLTNAPGTTLESFFKQHKQMFVMEREE